MKAHEIPFQGGNAMSDSDGGGSLPGYHNDFIHDLAYKIKHGQFTAFPWENLSGR
jgi:hypothetical protein